METVRLLFSARIESDATDIFLYLDDCKYSVFSCLHVCLLPFSAIILRFQSNIQHYSHGCFKNALDKTAWSGAVCAASHHM